MNFIKNESEQKLRGGYYTPLDLAVYICRWVTETLPMSVLEPSCGDGVFIEALAQASPTQGVSFTGFELIEEEAAKAERRCLSHPRLKADVYVRDFLDFAISEILCGRSTFDCAVGNPPFIRYQYLSSETQQKAEAIFRLLRLPFTRHTNAWVPFVLASVALLKPGGRLGMIVPAEIIHVMHSQSVRTYLGAACSRLLVIDPEELWFDGTLQGAVILFAEKKNHPGHDCEGVGIVQVSGRSFVAGDPSSLFDHAERINGKTVEGKWTRALLSASERELFDALSGHNQVHRFDEVAKVDVGIVTGANKFLGGVSAAALGMAGWGTALDAKSFFRTALVTVGRAYPDAEGSRSARLPDSPNQ